MLKKTIKSLAPTTAIQKASARRSGPYLKLHAVIEDEATGLFQAVIQFRDIRDRRREIKVPLSQIDDWRLLKRDLVNAGANLPPDAGHEFFAALGRCKTTAPHWLVAQSNGWRSGGHNCFVMVDQTIGDKGGSAKIVSPAPPRFAKRCKTRGTHVRWKTFVAKPAMFSSRMSFGICAAFAAPLLALSSVPSFGFLIFGPPKTAKTTCLIAAGSVMGFGKEPDLPNFKTTDAALPEVLANCNDMLLPINELGLLGGMTRSDLGVCRNLASQ